MSRIGKAPVPIPAKVKVEVKAGQIFAEGPKGKLDMKLPPKTAAEVKEGKVYVTRSGESAEAKALHGLGRALINNLVLGVSEGFSKKLEIHGVGFKAAVVGKKLSLNLGYSHPVDVAIPDSIKVVVEENTKVTIEGVNKQLVGEIASQIRSYYPPEPYKGKGVRYAGEQIVRKEGKTVA